MILKELIQELAATGYRCTPAMVAHAINYGTIPRPAKDSRGDNIYTQAHVEALRANITRRMDRMVAAGRGEQLVSNAGQEHLVAE